MNTTPTPTSTPTPTHSPVNCALFGDALSTADEKIAQAKLYAEQEGINIVYSYRDGEELPEDWGILIRSIIKRTGNKPQGVVISFIPSALAIIASTEGEAWAMQTIEDAIIEKVVLSVRPRGDAPFGGAIPRTMSDFITRRTNDTGISAYNDIASPIVELLRGAIPSLTKAELRQCLQSAAFATAKYAAMPQESWDNVITTMKTMAERAKLSTAIFEHWADTRYQQEETTSIDTSALEALLAGVAVTDDNTTDEPAEGNNEQGETTPA